MSLSDCYSLTKAALVRVAFEVGGTTHSIIIILKALGSSIIKLVHVILSLEFSVQDFSYVLKTMHQSIDTQIIPKQNQFKERSRLQDYNS